MADFVFNIAKGRAITYYENVRGNSPTESALIIVALAASPEADATLKDYDNLSALLAGSSNEATNSGYARKTLVHTDLSAPTVDDTNDWAQIDIPDQTWSAVAATGGAWSKILVCYDDDSTGGDDTNIIPLTSHDFAVTPDGSDIVMQVGADGFFRAA